MEENLNELGLDQVSKLAQLDQSKLKATVIPHPRPRTKVFFGKPPPNFATDDDEDDDGPAPLATQAAPLTAEFVRDHIEVVEEVLVTIELKLSTDDTPFSQGWPQQMFADVLKPWKSLHKVPVYKGPAAIERLGFLVKYPHGWTPEEEQDPQDVAVPAAVPAPPSQANSIVAHFPPAPAPLPPPVDGNKRGKRAVGLDPREEMDLEVLFYSIWHAAITSMQTNSWEGLVVMELIASWIVRYDKRGRGWPKRISLSHLLELIETLGRCPWVEVGEQLIRSVVHIWERSEHIHEDRPDEEGAPVTERATLLRRTLRTISFDNVPALHDLCEEMTTSTGFFFESIQTEHRMRYLVMDREKLAVMDTKRLDCHWILGLDRRQLHHVDIYPMHGQEQTRSVVNVCRLQNDAGQYDPEGEMAEAWRADVSISSTGLL
jgi:hypothetical protein